MFNTEKIHVLNKSKCNHEYYNTTGVGVVFNSITKNGAGYLLNWELATPTEIIHGNTVDEFITKLLQIKDELKLEKRSNYNKDLLVIYTTNLDQIYGFLHNYDENINRFGNYYFDFLDNFEFRDITLFFYKLENDVLEIAKHAQQLINESFIPNKYFYITPTQEVTKKIRKKCDSNIAVDLYPKSPLEYNELLSSYFGGFCICNYPGIIINELSAEFDRTSAYIYDLLIEKHLVEPLQEYKEFNDSWFDYVVDNIDDYAAFAKLEITCSGLKRGSDVFKDVYGNKLEPHKTTIINITNVDFKVLSELVTVIDYKVIKLLIGKKDYLPDYIRDVIHEYYINKIHNPNKLSKTQLNSIYGATVKKIKDRQAFKVEKDSAILAPQWGILTTSYARYNLIMLAKQLQGWLYTDTDSIYCLYKEDNVTKINQYNKQIRRNVYDYCNKFNLDYETFKDLGQFKLKHKIKKFKAIGKKQYMYTTEDGSFTFKGSGINGQNNESAYNGNIDTGYKVIGHFNFDITTEIINGKKYISNGSYYTNKEDVLSVIINKHVKEKERRI